jgi:hypothetical protein
MHGSTVQAPHSHCGGLDILCNLACDSAEKQRWGCYFDGVWSAMDEVAVGCCTREDMLFDSVKSMEAPEFVCLRLTYNVMRCGLH